VEYSNIKHPHNVLKCSKVKAKMSLCLTTYHTLKSYPVCNQVPCHEDMGVEVQLHTFLTLALNGSEWSASRPNHFTLGERVPGTHWIRDWVGPTASLDMVTKRKNTCPCQESNPCRPARSLVIILTELSRFLSYSW
jgi:hypothetical protein